MYEPDFLERFERYIDYEPYLDKNGKLIPLENRTLTKNAPQSAIDAFNEFKKLEAKAEKDDIYV